VLVYVEATTDPTPHFGFVVAKTVGNAVTRNLVKRRLRATAQQLLSVSQGDVVVRALPTSAVVSATQLAHDFEAALRASGGIIS
jgi:ribonuclease P protein component